MSKLASIRLEGYYKLRCSIKVTRWNYFGGNKDVRMVGRDFEMLQMSDMHRRRKRIG